MADELAIQPPKPPGLKPSASNEDPPSAMSHSRPPLDPANSQEFVKQSSLYQEFLAEREEILRHKWLESERLGYDIGFEKALLDWIRKHRDGWRAARRNGVPYNPAKAAASANASGTAQISPTQASSGGGASGGAIGGPTQTRGAR